ncbi:MAG: GNAT family N-acetyltransferase [Neomegalonema sp.]|nr:GNAT family N-acetyltransferase [Neomegalonema sp.]
MSISAPVQHAPDDAGLADVLDLVRRSFAYMDGRIDPPSSVNRLTIDAIAGACRIGEVWSISAPPDACIFMQERADRLLISKMAVASERRRRGLGRALISLAMTRAQSMGLKELELETRVELDDNHRSFERLGFHEVERRAHAGYRRPTYVVMRRAV